MGSSYVVEVEAGCARWGDGRGVVAQAEVPQDALGDSRALDEA
jgi:hypothetical protein